MGALEMLNCEPAIFLRTKTARMRSRNNILHDTISAQVDLHSITPYKALKTTIVPNK
jgi:hypothetical protein